MQNMGIFVKNLVISKNSSNFVPDKICVNRQWHKICYKIE